MDVVKEEWIIQSEILPERRDCCQTPQAARGRLERQKRRQVQLCDVVDNDEETLQFGSVPWRNIVFRGILNFLLKLQNVLQCAEAGADVDMCTGDGMVGWFFSRLLLTSCQLTSNVTNWVTTTEASGLFFPFRISTLYSVLCWNMHVCSFKCQCRVKKMWP